MLVKVNFKYVHLVSVIALLGGLLTYFVKINFNLPFMTADEIRFILSSPKEVADYALISGRYSSLIMIPFAEALSFSNPDLIHLIPRLISMLLLALGMILIIRKLGFSQLLAVMLTTFILLMHELDWQHNGLVSFFGIYNLLLASFILALVLSENHARGNWTFALSVLLLMGAYASELFIGLALCYLVLKIACYRRLGFMLRSPVFWSLAVYVCSYLIIKATTSLIHWNAAEMSNYLVGAVESYSMGQMLTAALLYFINSLPYYHKLAAPVSVSVTLSALILIGMSVYFIKVWLGINKAGSRTSEDIAAEKEWLLAAMLFLLAVVPNFLMALQPMKVDWILRNASVHYVFSYYTWIGLAIACLYFAKRNICIAGNAKVLSYVVVAVSILLSILSAKHNIGFSKEYKTSQAKWEKLNAILDQNRSKEVVVLPSYLQYPYISAVSPEQLKIYAKKYFDAQLKICRSDEEIKLNEEINEKAVKQEGFSGAEESGRWTVGAVATIKLLEENPKINFVELEISSVFYENRNSTLVITKGDKVFNYKIGGIGKFRFDLAGMSEGQIQIQLLIAKPMSPFKLGMSADTRDLGLMVKAVRFGFKESEKQERLHVMETCY